MRQGIKAPARGHFPQACRTVRTRGDQALVVGAEANLGDRSLMRELHGFSRRQRDVPNARITVSAGRREARLIPSHIHRINRAAMLPWRIHLLASPRVEDFDSGVPLK